MRMNEIGHLNIVADAGAVARRIIGAEDIKSRSGWPSAALHRDLDQMRRIAGRLPQEPGPAGRHPRR